MACILMVVAMFWAGAAKEKRRRRTHPVPIPPVPLKGELRSIFLLEGNLMVFEIYCNPIKICK